ncbi:MAG: patatin-like phospholipase family protein [Actinomycetota bacterium]
MKRGLVLGGGGLVGMAYHAGVLKALEDQGLDLSGVDVIVGTSAGSVIGSYLASGWDMGDFYAYAQWQHPEAEPDPNEQRREVRSIFTPLSRTRGERVRRGLGSLFAAAASRGYLRRALTGGRIPASALRRAFPSGLYSTTETRLRFSEDLPQEWPRPGLYLCTVDLYTGERVAFGHPSAPPAPLPDAVLASTAIPGVFPPVRIGDRQFVDGGVASATSLDLATDDGCDVILCVAPLGYLNDGVVAASEPRLWAPMLIRSLFARALSREVKEARAKGVQVFVIRPWLTELRSHGTNSMRHFDRAVFSEDARRGTLRLLRENVDHPVLASFKAGADEERAG